MDKNKNNRYCSDCRIYQSFESNTTIHSERNTQHSYCDKSVDKYTHEFSSKTIRGKRERYYFGLDKINKPNFNDFPINEELYQVSLLFCIDQLENEMESPCYD